MSGGGNSRMGLFFFMILHAIATPIATPFSTPGNGPPRSNLSNRGGGNNQKGKGGSKNRPGS